SMARRALDWERNILYLSKESDNFKRYNALDGTLMEPLPLKHADGKKASNIRICEQAVGPEGMIYFLGWTESYREGSVFRCTPDGTLVPFPGGQPKVSHMLKGAGANSARGFTVSRTGESFVLYYDDIKRPPEVTPVEPWERCMPLPVALAKFAADGSCVSTHFIRYLRSGANGVRVDSRGNVYVADNFMPAGITYPTDIAKAMPEDPLKRPYPARLADGSFDPLLRWIGCVVKFGPNGGAITGLPEGKNWPPTPRSSNDVYRPAPEVQWFMFNYHHLRVEGAEWQFHGICPIPAQYQGVTHVERCVCSGARFDLDPFDRVFVPDTMRHRITVLDSAGNIICRFGRYGNRDSDGLGFSHAAYVAAGGEYAFVGDTGNRRLVRVKFVYAAEEEREIAF
ncbi:MAG: hypothetical protein N2255_09700, partial [Kiritimatiellae bacterium]|nr:hypothetical protein [Kiritimatiellia bacterium]